MYMYMKSTSFVSESLTHAGGSKQTRVRVGLLKHQVNVCGLWVTDIKGIVEGIRVLSCVNDEDMDG